MLALCAPSNNFPKLTLKEFPYGLAQWEPTIKRLPYHSEEDINYVASIGGHI